MAKRWTKQEDEILAKFIERGKLPKAMSEVSASLGRTEHAVYLRYISLKNKSNQRPSKKDYRFYTKEEEKTILDYSTNPKNTNLQELSKQLGRTSNEISTKLYRLRKSIQN